MADISKITLPNGNTYDLKDANAIEGVLENRQSIIDQATELTNSYTAMVENTQSAILQTVQNTYTAKTETEELQGIVNTQFDQTSRQITAVVTDVATLNDGFSTKVAQSITWAKLDTEGLHLGTGSSENFEAVLSDSKLSFKQGGEEIAYLSNNKLYISNAAITNSLAINGITFQDDGTALILK